MARTGRENQPAFGLEPSESRMALIKPAPLPGAQQGIIMRYERLDISWEEFLPSLERVPWRVQKLDKERY